MTEQLSCGCRRGEWLCPEAVRLLRATVASGLKLRIDWEMDYDQAMQAFNRHFEQWKEESK